MKQEGREEERFTSPGGLVARRVTPALALVSEVLQVGQLTSESFVDVTSEASSPESSDAVDECELESEEPASRSSRSTALVKLRELSEL